MVKAKSALFTIAICLFALIGALILMATDDKPIQEVEPIQEAWVAPVEEYGLESDGLYEEEYESFDKGIE